MGIIFIAPLGLKFCPMQTFGDCDLMGVAAASARFPTLLERVVEDMVLM
jgi:hypothetical protein